MNAFIIVCILALLILTAICAMGADGDAPAQPDEAQIFARSLVSMGDTARLQHVLAKARRGETVTVGVIGGSITAGARASTVENRWGNWVARWWRETFPNAEIKFVNAGIGATGSSLGAHRVQEHLIKHRPDLVIAEYAVNDPNTEFAAETLEGMVRQILEQPNQPAVMLLFTMHRSGGNAQEWHSKVGNHYGLPMVSFRDGLWPEIEAGRMKWEDVEGDEVHPNDRGHKYCADFLTSVMGKVLATLPKDAALAAIKPVPAPLLSDTYEYATVLTGEKLAPLSAEGWTEKQGPFGMGWETSKPGSAIEFEVEGTSIATVFWRIKGPMGIANATVDDGKPMKLNAWFDADWGGYSVCEFVAMKLEPGKHRVRIELTEEKSEASEGNQFHLQALLVAGLK